MALPASHTPFPAPHPLRETQGRMLSWFAGYNPVLNAFPECMPDPAGIQPSGNPRARYVGANIVQFIASTFAHMVLGEPPVLDVSHESAVNTLTDSTSADQSQGDMQALMERNGSWAEITRALEYASAFGEGYLVAVIDPAFLEDPILQAIPPQAVDPSFKYGNRLTSARVYKTLGYDGQKVFRLVEDRDNVTRVIRTGLYVGTADKIGSRIPLTEHPDAAMYADEAPYPEGMTATVWRVYKRKSSLYIETPYGGSDFEGKEAQLAALDGIETSLARDFRLGGARLVVPSSAMTRGLSGVASYLDREIIVDINVPAETTQPTLIQSPIRVSDHVAAYTFRLTALIQGMGYSLQTFGLGDAGTAESGTALRLKQAATIAAVTAARELLAPVIADIAYNLAVGARVVHGQDIIPSRPSPAFGELVTPDPQTVASQILTLMTAGVVSVETGVKMAQPELNPEEVDAEVARIHGADASPASADPFLP